MLFLVSSLHSTDSWVHFLLLCSLPAQFLNTHSFQPFFSKHTLSFRESLYTQHHVFILFPFDSGFFLDKSFLVLNLLFKPQERREKVCFFTFLVVSFVILFVRIFTSLSSLDLSQPLRDRVFCVHFQRRESLCLFVQRKQGLNRGFLLECLYTSLAAA